MKPSLLTLISLAILSQSAMAETLYVSDELKIAMRSGATEGHRIVKFIRSGTKLEVLDTSEEGDWKLVKIAGDKQGWVKVTEVSQSPAAREQIAGLERKIASLRKSLGQRESEVKDLKSSLKDSETQNRKLDSFSKGKSDELEKLKQVAARPVQLAREKQQLEIELSKAVQERDRALAENESLSSSSLKEWFIIGAAVSLGSLIIGLIIPSIRWKKKDSWGGGF